MKQLFAFIRKETVHLLRDRSTLIVIIAIPIIQLVLFGFAITTEVKNVKVAVFDPSKDNITRQIVEKIDNSKYFDVSQMLTSPSQIDAVFREDAQMDLVVVFSDDFESNLVHSGEASIQLLADASDPNQGVSYAQYISAILGDYQEQLIKESGAEFGKFTVNTETRMLYNPHNKSAYYFVPGLMGMILMLICAMMTSISIVREKEMGTMEVLLSSPLKPIYIFISKMVPYLVLSLINLTVIIVISMLLLEMPIRGNIVALYGVSLLFIFVALLLGMFISNLVKTQVAAIVITSMGLLMPVILLSGMIFPIESMPKILQLFSHIVPAKWYTMAIKKIMVQGVSVSFALKEIAVLFSMATLLLFASVRTFKIRLM